MPFQAMKVSSPMETDQPAEHTTRAELSFGCHIFHHVKILENQTKAIFLSCIQI